MTDIAKLVLQADTRQLKQATKDLGAVKKAGADAGKQADEDAKRFMKLYDQMFPEKAKAREHVSNLQAVNEAHRRGVISAEEHAAMTKRLNDEATGASAGLSRLAKVGIAAVITAAGAAAAGLIKMTRSAINTADEMTKAAQSIGIGVEELSRLRYAAELSGVSFDGLKSSLNIMNRNLFDINGKGNAATKALTQMGIAARGADGQLKSSTDILKEMADVFAKMPDGAEKGALAMAVLGRSGADMIPLLNGGADAMARLLNEADQFGIVIDERTGRRAEEFNDNLTRLGKVVEGLGLKVASELLPTLIDLTNWLIKNADSIQKAAKDAADLIRGFTYLAEKTFSLAGALKNELANALGISTERLEWFGRKAEWVINPLGALLGKVRELGAELGAQGGFGRTFTTFNSELQRRIRLANSPQIEFSPSGGSGGGGGRSGGSGRSSAISAIEKEAREAERALLALTRSTQSVMDRLDPMGAAARRLSEEIDLINKAVAQNVISLEDGELAIVSLQYEYEKFTTAQHDRAVDKLTKALDGLSDRLNPAAAATRRYLEEWSMIDEAVNMGLRTFEEGLGLKQQLLNERIKKLREEAEKDTKKVGDTFYDMSNRVLGALNQLAMGIKQGGFLGILSGVMNLLLQAGSIGAFGKNIQANINAPRTTPAPTARSMGGPVQAGKPYMVGERGPELFMPGRQGRIVSNDNMRGGGMTFNIDARGSSDPELVRRQVEQGILEAAPAIVAAAQQRTVNTLRRPRLAGAL